MINAGLLANTMNSKFQRNDLLDQSAQSLLDKANGPLTEEGRKKVAKDFESLFIGQMLEHMFGESSGEEQFGGKESDDIYKSMMVEQYGKAISDSGGIGIAKHIEQALANRVLMQNQEV